MRRRMRISASVWRRSSRANGTGVTAAAALVTTRSRGVPRPARQAHERFFKIGANHLELMEPHPPFEQELQHALRLAAEEPDARAFALEHTRGQLAQQFV